MRVQPQVNINILQTMLGNKNKSTRSLLLNMGKPNCDEYVQGVVSPYVSYSKQSVKKESWKSVLNAINFHQTEIWKNHGETQADFTINGRIYSKKDIPTIKDEWCNSITAENNTVRFVNGEYYKYKDENGKTHIFACQNDRVSQPYSDQVTGRQDDKSRKIATFWNLLSHDGTYLNSYYSMDEQEKMLNDAGVKEGFFTVEAGDKKQEYYFSHSRGNGSAGVAVRKFEYDANYEMLTGRGSTLFDKYNVGDVFKFGGKEYVLNEDRKFDIPYGEDIFDIEFPKMKG